MELVQEYQHKLMIYLKKTGDFIANIIRYRRVNSCCTGGQISYAYIHEGSWANLIETGTAFQPPAAQMREEVIRIWPGTLAYLSVNIPLSGHVTDEATNQPIQANITVPRITWLNNEQRFSNARRFGLYHLWIPNGSWTVVFSANGYQTKEENVIITDQGTILNVKMKKN